ncbi:MAG: hypothetical protein C0P77_007475 [Thermoanaerobacterales bacterium]|jgi:hypothetical protein
MTPTTSALDPKAQAPRKKSGINPQITPKIPVTMLVTWSPAPSCAGAGW